MSKMKWISCSERLPKHEEEVLVTICCGTDDGESICLKDNVEKACFYDFKGELNESDLPYFVLFGGGGVPLFDEVSAWMPLPEPYREDGEA